MSQTYDGERLYSLAKAAAKKQWGAGWSHLGPEIKRTAILAQVLMIIGAQDDADEAGPNMVRLADYAVVRVLSDVQAYQGQALPGRPPTG